eukprot:TRINITY_DN7132_c0_g1_i3.p1 TRINITY_DN7132_c0_g1~~TRINITY_DN7132_c0_g1_i3.p1  ORF type:complete len:729 (+),score=199.69 TRINITY_DN7132_c0_g1_i3:50-2236(+)
MSMINVNVKLPTGESYHVEISSEGSVGALKALLEAESGVSSAKQRIIYQGKVLKDDQIINACGIRDGFTVHMVQQAPPPLGSAPVVTSSTTTTTTTATEIPAPAVADPLQSIPNMANVAEVLQQSAQGPIMMMRVDISTDPSQSAQVRVRRVSAGARIQSGDTISQLNRLLGSALSDAQSVPNPPPIPEIPEPHAHGNSFVEALAPTIARFNSVNQYITNLLARFSEEAARESSITDVAERERITRDARALSASLQHLSQAANLTSDIFSRINLGSAPGQTTPRSADDLDSNNVQSLLRQVLGVPATPPGFRRRVHSQQGQASRSIQPSSSVTDIDMMEDAMRTFMSQPSQPAAPADPSVSHVFDQIFAAMRDSVSSQSPASLSQVMENASRRLENTIPRDLLDSGSGTIGELMSIISEHLSLPDLFMISRGGPAPFERCHEPLRHWMLEKMHCSGTPSEAEMNSFVQSVSEEICGGLSDASLPLEIRSRIRPGKSITKSVKRTVKISLKKLVSNVVSSEPNFGKRLSDVISETAYMLVEGLSRSLIGGIDDAKVVIRYYAYMMNSNIGSSLADAASIMAVSQIMAIHDHTVRTRTDLPQVEDDDNQEEEKEGKNAKEAEKKDAEMNEAPIDEDELFASALDAVVSDGADVTMPASHSNPSSQSQSDETSVGDDPLLAEALHAISPPDSSISSSSTSAADSSALESLSSIVSAWGPIIERDIGRLESM